MESKAKIVTTGRGLDGGFTVTLALESATRAELEALEGIDLTAILKEYSEKRGNNANAYFHRLVREIARHKDIKRSEAYIKNDLISQAAFYEYMEDGNPQHIQTNIEPELLKESTSLHATWISTEYDAASDEVLYLYYICRGTHTYNRKEMSHLIELTVQQAKALDIETLPHYEIQRLEEQWEQIQAKKNIKAE